MTFSKMEAALEDAFVEWINLFDCKSNPIDTVVELADGVILSEILTDIDSKWFKQISADDNTNWVVRFNNLKKLHRLITRYFEDIIGQDPELLPTVNLNAIAKDAELHDILLLCQLVVVVAVQSDNNHVYIDMIQSMSQKSQQALMLSIEEVMNHFNEPDSHRASQLSSTSVTTTSKSLHFENDMPYRYQLEFDKILMEKKQTEAAHNQLLMVYDDLRERFDDIMIEKEDLKTRLRDMEEAIAQANDTGKADFVMRTEIEHLKQDLERSEDRRLETELVLEKQVASIQELTRKVEELQAKADEAAALQDQLDEYLHEAQRVSKMESLLEKYKQKIEDTAELKHQIKALEEQNTSLLERSHHVEDEYRKVLAFKTLMDSYKEQVQQLELSNRAISKERDLLEEELRNATETCRYLENDRDHKLEQVQLLEEQIRELEIGGGTTMEKVSSHRSSAVIEEDIGNDNMEENMKKANITELRLTIVKLQRQMTELQDTQHGSSETTKEIESLRRQIEEATLAKEKLYKDFKDMESERNRLRDELMQIRHGIPDSLLNKTETIMAFKSRILDLEKECHRLKENTIQLELAVLEGTRSITKDAASLERFEKEHAKTQDRLNRLEDITKMQLHDINRMLVEANYLNGVSSGDPSEPPQLSNEDLNVIKEQNASLQIKVLHLQEGINESQGKIRKVRDMIKLYSQLLQEMNARFSTSAEDTGATHIRIPRTKEEENDLLKKQIHDVRLQSRQEQQLIVSAWYDLAQRNQREMTTLSLRSTPSSWLGKQRKLLDIQLRKRLC